MSDVTSKGRKAAAAASARCGRHGAVRAGWPILVAVALSLGNRSLAGQYETVVFPVAGPKGMTRPAQFELARSWSPGRLGFVADSLLMQLTYHPQLGFGDAEPRDGTRMRRADYVDSVFVYLGHTGATTKRIQYEVFITTAHERDLGGTLAKLHMTRGRKGPYLEREQWDERQPGDDLMDPTHGSGVPSARVADTVPADSVPMSAATGDRWTSFTQDTMVVRIRLDSNALNSPVWLPTARRWTVDSDETARFTVTVAFYWIRELHLQHHVHRNPSAAANKRAWQFAERLLGAPVPAY